VCSTGFIGYRRLPCGIAKRVFHGVHRFARSGTIGTRGTRGTGLRRWRQHFSGGRHGCPSGVGPRLRSRGPTAPGGWGLWLTQAATVEPRPETQARGRKGAGAGLAPRQPSAGPRVSISPKTLTFPALDLRQKMLYIAASTRQFHLALLAGPCQGWGFHRFFHFFDHIKSCSMNRSLLSRTPRGRSLPPPRIINFNICRHGA
jgi:hypothetical protein